MRDVYTHMISDIHFHCTSTSFAAFLKFFFLALLSQPQWLRERAVRLHTTVAAQFFVLGLAARNVRELLEASQLCSIC